MKKIIIETFFGLVFSIGLFAQNTILHRSVPGTQNQGPIVFDVKLPPSYKHTTKKYPVIYYLHGMDDHYGGRSAQKITEFLQKQADMKIIPEFILVIPDGKDGLWGNYQGGNPILESDIIDKLIPYINKSFRSDTVKHLMMGWSSGGTGALYFYMKYPEIFCGAISLDGALTSWEEFKYFLPTKAQQIANSDSAYYYQHFTPYPWANKNMERLIRGEEPSIFLVGSLFKLQHHRFLDLCENQGILVNSSELDCEHDFNCIISEVGNDLTLFLSHLFSASVL